MASSNLAPIALAGAGLWWWQSRRSKTQAAKPATQPKPETLPEAPPPLQPPLSPFAVGSQCTQLMPTATLERWLDTTVATAVLEVLDALVDDPQEDADLWDLTDEVMARASEPCVDKSSDAYALAYKMVWCAVMTMLIAQQRIGHELEEVMARCQDAAFDPFRARPSRRPPTPQDDLPTEPSGPSQLPVPPIPPGPDATPQIPDLPDPATLPPTPPIPPAPLGSEGPDTLPPPPIPAPDSGTPPNIESPTTREGIQETSLLRLVAAGERAGQTRARPSTVVLALDPEWDYAEQAIAGLEHYARQYPQLSFYVVSFWDSQQHFGLPELLGGLKYILSSANAEGIAARDPIIGNNALLIQPTQWEAVLRHATGAPVSGLVGRPATQRATTLGRTLGAQLLGLDQNRAPTNRPKQTPAPRRRLQDQSRLRQRPAIPLRRFATARLHRRHGA